jgi:acyl-homoserine-lactone acylase
VTVAGGLHALPPEAAAKKGLADGIAVLRAWDERWSADSVATSLTVYWGTELMKTAGRAAYAAEIPS